MNINDLISHVNRVDKILNQLRGIRKKPQELVLVLSMERQM